MLAESKGLENGVDLKCRCISPSACMKPYLAVSWLLTQTQDKRVLIKDMAQYFVPPNGRPASIAPSLTFPRRGIGTEGANGVSTNGARRGSLKTRAQAEVGVPPPPDAPYPTYTELENPTVVPVELLEQFHFVFLIRHPKSSIPSYYRCCIPPLREMTGWDYFRGDEAGYVELRRVFDFLRAKGLIGPDIAGQKGSADGVNGADGHHHTRTGAQICVIDADDLLDKPADMMQAFCDSVGFTFSPDMLKWDSPEDEDYAAKAFEKWKGFHEDVIHSRDLKPRGHVSTPFRNSAQNVPLRRILTVLQQHRSKSVDESYLDWTEKYGKEGANIIRKAVDENIEHYEYLKQFCVKV